MKLAYVTGATGCVGRNLVDVLLEDGWEVVVLHRKSSDLARLRGCKVRFQEVDLHDISNVRESIPTGVNAIFHVAGNTSHWSRDEREQWKDNVLATRNLAQVALEKGVERFIFTSTGATRFYQDTDRSGAMDIYPPYVRSKRLSELEVYDSIREGLDAVILHPIIVVGAYDYNSYGQIFNALKRYPIKISFPGKITFCHARDVAEAHLRAYERGKRGERYLLGGIYTTWREFFQSVADSLGIRRTVRAAPGWLVRVLSHLQAAAEFFTRQRPQLTPELLRLITEEPEISLYDRKKAQEDLGYQSRSLDMMVRDCRDWLVHEGRI